MLSVLSLHGIKTWITFNHACLARIVVVDLWRKSVTELHSENHGSSKFLSLLPSLITKKKGGGRSQIRVIWGEKKSVSLLEKTEQLPPLCSLALYINPVQLLNNSGTKGLPSF